jgi:hypothetical protein
VTLLPIDVAASPLVTHLIPNVDVFKITAF